MSDLDPEDMPPGVRRLAEEMITGALGRADRNLICSLARAVREANATRNGTNAALVPPALRALACAIELLPENDLTRTLAELRIFARLNVTECARLLAVAPDNLARRWRVVQVLLFTRARRFLREDPHSAHDAAAGPSDLQP